LQEICRIEKKFLPLQCSREATKQNKKFIDIGENREDLNE